MGFFMGEVYFNEDKIAVLRSHTRARPELTR